MATLQDVAKAAGVSKTTVSRFLNGSLDLPEGTASQIHAAIRALDYRPNPHARRLSLGRSDTIALIVPDIASPFFATFVASVEAEADARGLSLSLHATLNRRDRELSYIETVVRGHADGLIFVTNHADDGTLARQLTAARNCVIVDEDVQGADLPKVFADNEQGGYLAGGHLARAGHAHVMLIGGDCAMISGQRRLAGCLRGLREVMGEDARLDRHQGGYDIESGRAAGRAYLSQPPHSRPTAIFATSDELLIGLLEELRAARVRVPEDVSIVGFDDVGPLHLFAPAITAVRQPVRELGRRALALLLERNGNGATSPQEVLLPVSLIERGSVAPPSVRQDPPTERIFQ